ncbi:MAG: hypothetical protein ACSHW0_06755 [Thalassotalea sp.]
MVDYARELLLGKWYRNTTDEQGNQISEYAQMAADGSFEFTFIFHNNEGEITQQIIEIGDWGLVGDIHFTITKGEIIDDEHYPVDLNEPDNYNAYRVLALTNQTFQYQHIISPEIFISRRITNELGNC